MRERTRSSRSPRIGEPLLAAIVAMLIALSAAEVVGIALSAALHAGEDGGADAPLPPSAMPDGAGAVLMLAGTDTEG
jgi:hypothetical protein